MVRIGVVLVALLVLTPAVSAGKFDGEWKATTHHRSFNQYSQGGFIVDANRVMPLDRSSVDGSVDSSGNIEFTTPGSTPNWFEGTLSGNSGSGVWGTCYGGCSQDGTWTATRVKSWDSGSSSASPGSQSPGSSSFDFINPTTAALIVFSIVLGAVGVNEYSKYRKNKDAQLDSRIKALNDKAGKKSGPENLSRPQGDRAIGPTGENHPPMTDLKHRYLDHNNRLKVNWKLAGPDHKVVRYEVYQERFTGSGNTPQQIKVGDLPPDSTGFDIGLDRSTKFRNVGDLNAIKIRAIVEQPNGWHKEIWETVRVMDLQHR